MFGLLDNTDVVYKYRGCNDMADGTIRYTYNVVLIYMLVLLRVGYPGVHTSARFTCLYMTAVPQLRHGKKGCGRRRKSKQHAERKKKEQISVPWTLRSDLASLRLSTAWCACLHTLSRSHTLHHHTFSYDDDRAAHTTKPRADAGWYISRAGKAGQRQQFLQKSQKTGSEAKR